MTPIPTPEPTATPDQTKTASRAARQREETAVSATMAAKASAVTPTPTPSPSPEPEYRPDPAFKATVEAAATADSIAGATAVAAERASEGRSVASTGAFQWLAPEVAGIVVGVKNDTDRPWFAPNLSMVAVAADGTVHECPGLADPQTNEVVAGDQLLQRADLAVPPRSGDALVIVCTMKADPVAVRMK